jgi:hypothetical protein
MTMGHEAAGAVARPPSLRPAPPAPPPLPPRRPRLLIVSYLAGAAGTPRGERSRELAAALAATWEVDVLAGPEIALMDGPPRRTPRRMRRLARRVRDTVLVDKHEPWSRRRLARWRPEADLALVIGPPFSFAGQAARRLARAGIPFVFDAGDPWTARTARTPAGTRARREEAFTWSHAAGAIVTTQEQADEVRRRTPAPVLVRPNGHAVPPAPAAAPAARPRSTRRLRLAHFGQLYAVRVDLEPFAMELRASGLWEEIELHLFGEDWDRVLDGARRHLSVVEHDPVPWPQVIELATDYSAALVVGNRGGMQLPSKVVQYLTVPVPRVAVVADPFRDCIARYVRDKPAWLVCGATESGTARRVHEHCARKWRPEELASPPGESWPEVTAAIDAFLHEVAAARSSHSA